MTWHQYLCVHSIVVVMIIVLGRRLFSGQVGRLVRIAVGAAALAFFVDYPAEDQVIWYFDSPSAVYLIKVPLENMFFLSSAVPCIISIHEAWKRLLRRAAVQAKTQAQADHQPVSNLKSTD